jgi:hypothetical protein
MNERLPRVGEAKDFGYDPELVNFFLNNYPDLLEKIWNQNSDIFDKVLANRFSDNEIANQIELLSQPDEDGKIFKMGTLRLVFEALRTYHDIYQ